MNRLKIASEKAKIKLSSEKKAFIELYEFFNNELLYIVLTREIFEKICENIFQRLIDIIEKVLDDSKKTISDINEIVFVGGSTRIPKIKELIHLYFPNININDSINPDETVAYGAAIHAAKLMKQGNDILNNIILRDITPFSLGVDEGNFNENSIIKKKGNLMSIIIPKGSRFPIKQKKYYKTSLDYQDTVIINIYEGENKYVKDNHLLDTLKLVNLPKKPKGEVNIDVIFDVDKDGILSVTAIETSERIQKTLRIIKGKQLYKKKIIENNNNLNVSFRSDDEKEIKSYREEMNEYYKYFKNSDNIQDKCRYIDKYIQVLLNYLNTFYKEGNDTLGNKYFFYIKTLFNSYRTFIKLKNEIKEDEKNLIIQNCNKYLNILSKFKNINYINYIELLDLFDVQLSEFEKKELFQAQKEIRNDILLSLVTEVMKLLKEKGEEILLNNSKFSKYNSRYVFQNCIQIGERFKLQKEESKNYQIKKKYEEYLDNCKTEIKKIDANSLFEIDKSKKNKKLFDNTKNIKREELLILLDNYEQAYINIKDIRECNYEKAIIKANIVKIQYKYLNFKNYESLKKMCEDSINLIKSINENCKEDWFVEINSISKEILKTYDEQKKLEKESFELKYKDKFEELEKFPKNTDLEIIEFIEYILKKYPPKNNPLKKNKTVGDYWKKDPKSFIDKLSAKYSTDNLKNKTEDEMFIFRIYDIINHELNKIISDLNQKLDNSIEE